MIADTQNVCPEWLFLIAVAGIFAVAGLAGLLRWLGGEWDRTASEIGPIGAIAVVLREAKHGGPGGTEPHRCQFCEARLEQEDRLREEIHRHEERAERYRTVAIGLKADAERRLRGGLAVVDAAEIDRLAGELGEIRVVTEAN